MSKYHFVKKKYLHERIYKDARKHVRDFFTPLIYLGD